MKAKKLSLQRVLRLLRKSKMKAEEIDLVVGIGKSGLVPASMAAKKLNKGLKMIWVKLYGEGIKPEKLYDKPRLTKKVSFNPKGKKILLVDDFVRSGKTMGFVSGLLRKRGASRVKKLAIAGQRQYCLLKTSSCIEFPWNKTGGRKE